MFLFNALRYKMNIKYLSYQQLSFLTHYWLSTLTALMALPQIIRQLKAGGYLSSGAKEREGALRLGAGWICLPARTNQE